MGAVPGTLRHYPEVWRCSPCPPCLRTNATAPSGFSQLLLIQEACLYCIQTHGYSPSRPGLPPLGLASSLRCSIGLRVPGAQMPPPSFNFHLPFWSPMSCWDCGPLCPMDSRCSQPQPGLAACMLEGLSSWEQVAMGTWFGGGGAYNKVGSLC